MQHRPVTTGSARPLALVLLGLIGACSADPAPPASGLDIAFTQAASDFDVPRDLLVSVSYAMTRLDHRQGVEAFDSAVGLMQLHANGHTPSLDAASQAIGYDVDTLVEDPVANIRGGAAMLAAMARHQQDRTGEPVDTLEEWYPIVSTYSGADDMLIAEGFSRQVYDFLEFGFMAQAGNGEWIEVEGRPLTWRARGTMQTAGSSLVDQYVPASASNYTNSSRTAVDTVVIHTTEGSYSGAVSWFQNSSASASAHYVIRSSDGEITQMVDEEDIAWHAGDWGTNQTSIGIEHEGYISAPETWYTEAMYQSSAALVRDLCDRYGIPKDRSHIIAHAEVPGCPYSGGGSSCHTDPGSGWDWDYFMDLVNQSGGSGGGGTTAITDGSKTGAFEATVHSSAYGITDTCSGRVSGTATNGVLYLTGTCRLDNHGDRSGDVPLTWSASVQGGTSLDTRMVVEGYSAQFTGQVNTDGSTYTEYQGTQTVGGDLGTLTVDLVLRTDA